MKSIIGIIVAVIASLIGMAYIQSLHLGKCFRSSTYAYIMGHSCRVPN